MFPKPSLKAEYVYDIEFIGFESSLQLQKGMKNIDILLTISVPICKATMALAISLRIFLPVISFNFKRKK